MSDNASELELPDPRDNRSLRLTVRNVAALNLSYFGIEFAVALAIGSVALFADSVDFLEDGAVNLLILAGLGFSATRRAKLGMLLRSSSFRRSQRFGPLGTTSPPGSFRNRSRCP